MEAGEARERREKRRERKKGSIFCGSNRNRE